MLQLIRGKVGSWVIKILFVLLVVALGGVGLNGIFGSGGVRATVATVGDQNITVQRLSRAFELQLQRLQQQYGPSFTVELAIGVGMLDQAMEGLVNEALFDQAADALGVQAPNDLIREEIQRNQLFQDSTGEFSRAQFNRYLSVAQLDEASFIAQRRRELARQDLFVAISTGVTTPDILADALHRFRNETRHVSAILITSSTVGDAAAPSEADIEAYYAENEQQYMAPEYRELQIVSLTAAHLADSIEIDEEDLLLEYELRQSDYEVTEERAFDQIVVPDEETAKRISVAARRGVSLEAAIAAVEAADVPVIPLELASRGDFLPALAGPGFALLRGGVTVPVESPFGWHVLQVTEIVEGGITPFETVRAEIAQELKLDEAQDLILDVSNELDDLIASDVSLEDAAERLNLPLVATGPVARDGTLRDGGRLEGVPALPDVLAVGFNQFAGVMSPIEETADENYFVVRTATATDPALRPLDEVREDIVTAWTDRQTAIAAQALAEATAERLDGGEAVADVAAELGAVMVEQANLRRDGANRGTLPQPLIDGVFAAAVGDAAVAPAADGYVVALVEAVTPAPDLDDQTREDIAAGQTQSIAGDLLVGFAQSLRSQYDIDIDTTSMSRLYQTQHEPM